MQRARSLYLVCVLFASACAFEPARLAGGPAPALPDASGPDAEPAPDAVVAPAPDAAPADAGPAAGLCDPGDPALIGCFGFEDDTGDDSSAGLVVTGSGIGFDQGQRGRALVTTDQSALNIAET
ncbi:MAG TPA: hypothetical protein VNM90_08950, partial [Haliangium sp.]|nr:hypothetical protein [Haliangium sp.]